MPRRSPGCGTGCRRCATCSSRACLLRRRLVLTGDLAARDDEGYFWFVGRGDDVIKSAGHVIGPVEVESVLMEHHAVAEAGVVGLADPVAGRVVTAYVALRPGDRPSDRLARPDRHRHPERDYPLLAMLASGAACLAGRAGAGG